ncbi:MAG: UDP-N-acetylmuramoyl-tripeptide--D-alanyl-D-alanine ligase [bacterium]|nr:UDP-N-acetylmuramoyl-tripeptide--D-alanyl-D-alanine ligase [bacterium]
MEQLSINEIVNSCNGTLISGSIDQRIEGISIDSRTIKPGDLFIALKGENFDGHDFIKSSFRKGGVGAIVSKSGDYEKTDKVIIKVEDTLTCLQRIAEYYRKRFTLKVIGITGSSGKTTTKEMIATLLSKRYSVLKSHKNYNNEIGVPLTLLGLEKAHQIAVIEMGMNAIGEIEDLSKISHPDIGLITNIGDAHIGFLSTREKIANEKFCLIKNLPRDGIAILNADDPLIIKMKDGMDLKDIITFGIEKKAKTFASNIEMDKYGTKFLLDGRYWVRMKTFGIHNIYNAIAATSCAKAFGIDYSEIVEGLEHFKPLSMRGEIIEIQNLRIIDDAYNANPQSMKKAIDTICNFKDGKLILILGDMLELGEKEKVAHLEIGKYVASSKVDILVTVGNLSKSIAEGASIAGFPKKDIYTFLSNEDIAEFLLSIQEPCTVLIKGSRKMKLEEIITKIKERCQVRCT